MSAKSVLRTIDLEWVGDLEFTYRLVDAEISVWDGEIHCLDLGTIYILDQDGSVELFPMRHSSDDFLKYFLGYLTREAVMCCLDDLAEIEAEIRENLRAEAADLEVHVELDERAAEKREEVELELSRDLSADILREESNAG